MPKFKDCSKERQQILTDAYNSFIQSSVLINHFSGLRDQMQERWGNLSIVCGTRCTGDCEDDNGNCLEGARNSTRIIICKFDSPRVGAILFHELVHECGGSELDSEALEHACLATGSRPPTNGDYPKFCNDDQFGTNANERMGRYVIWNAATGEVWVRENVGGNPTRGRLLFQSKNFVHPNGECEKEISTVV